VPKTFSYSLEQRLTRLAPDSSAEEIGRGLVEDDHSILRYVS
jgi:hypothetical protein